MIYGYIRVSSDKQTGTMTKKTCIKCRLNGRRSNGIVSNDNGRCYLTRMVLREMDETTRQGRCPNSILSRRGTIISDAMDEI